MTSLIILLAAVAALALWMHFKSRRPRNPRSGWAAWLIGKHPSRTRCWLALFVAPTSAMAALLYADPGFWFVPALYAIVRVAVARKNWTFRSN